MSWAPEVFFEAWSVVGGTNCESWCSLTICHFLPHECRVDESQYSLCFVVRSGKNDRQVELFTEAFNEFQMNAAWRGRLRFLGYPKNLHSTISE